MLKIETIDRERVTVVHEWDSLTPEEKAFLEGARFALDWVKGGIRFTSPIRFIRWRRRSKDPYRVFDETDELTNLDVVRPYKRR